MKLVLQKKENFLANEASGGKEEKIQCNMKPYQTTQMAKLQEEKQTKTSKSNGKRRWENE